MLTSLLVSILISLFVALLRHLSGVPPLVVWSDGFFASGVIVLSFALLMLLLSRGAIDTLFYAATSLFPFGRATPYDCRAKKREGKGKEKAGTPPAVIVGAAFLVLGVFLSFL